MSRKDEITLPSGAVVDINDPNFSLCRTVDDMVELKYALQEKIIDIELQIDLFECGAIAEHGRIYAADWLPRAKAALKWAKLRRDEAQHRAGRLSDIEKRERSDRIERAVIDVLRHAAAPDDFRALMTAATRLLEAKRPMLQVDGAAP